MKKPIFTGVCTALVTPFLDGRVNYPMMEMLLRRQMEAGIPAVVLSGTTGEAPTLSDPEKLELFRRCKDYVGDGMQIIAGTGSNSTEHSVWLSREAEKCAVDALLVVSPYYNKATEEGLFSHYLAIAHAVSLPVIVYNVPGRTGLDIPLSVCKRLSRVPNIAGIKEASTDLKKISNIISQCGSELPVWSGNDDLAVPVAALGGAGVISTAANAVPGPMNAMVRAALDGDFDTAADLHRQLLPLMEALFSEVNPVPVKAAMKILGYDCGGCRLPLTEAKQETQKLLQALLT